MSNPWLKKNPFMSMWLSTANRMAGTLRGQAAAQAQRQLKAAVTATTRESLSLWSAAGKPPAARARRKR